jgi:hypothetical protein
MSERIRAGHDGDTRRRPATALPVSLLSAGAGFYLACFAYWLVVPVLFFTLLSGLIGLRLLGLVSDSNQAGAALSVGLELARASDAAPIVAGWLGVLLVLVQTIRTVRGSAGWGRIQRSAAIVIGVAGIAAAVDVWYGVTPYADRLLPRSDLATAQSVTCRLTVSEVAALNYKQSGCVAEVEGVLAYSNHRFTLHPVSADRPSIRVFFFRARRTLFWDSLRMARPLYYGPVEHFVGRPVRIIGRVFAGQIEADVHHVAVTQADMPPLQRRP